MAFVANCDAPTCLAYLAAFKRQGRYKIHYPGGIIKHHSILNYRYHNISQHCSLFHNMIVTVSSVLGSRRASSVCIAYGTKQLGSDLPVTKCHQMSPPSLRFRAKANKRRRKGPVTTCHNSVISVKLRLRMKKKHDKTFSISVPLSLPDKAAECRWEKQASRPSKAEFQSHHPNGCVSLVAACTIRFLHDYVVIICHLCLYIQSIDLCPMIKCLKYSLKQFKNFKIPFSPSFCKGERACVRESTGMASSFENVRKLRKINQKEKIIINLIYK